MSPSALHSRIPKQNDYSNLQGSRARADEPARASREAMPHLDGRARCRPAINSDHLTLLAAFSMLAAGLCYWNGSPAALLAAVGLLAVNWFGDSLDGTLARVRRHERPALRVLCRSCARRPLYSVHLCRARSRRPHESCDWRRIPGGVLPPDDRDRAGDARGGSVPHLVLEVRPYRAAHSSR